MHCLRVVGLMCLLAAALASCDATTYQNRYGPPPVIAAADVQASTANQLQILKNLADAAGVNPPSVSPDWFAVMEAGFNYVDEKCDVYITDLFKGTREKDKIKGLATLADKTSGAILFASGAAKVTMAVVAQSFGFAEGATDLIAGSYLYQIGPDAIQNIVNETRKAYRLSAYAKRRSIMYPTLAYHHVQKYLEICLPQTIEANVNDALKKAKGVADTTPGPGINPELGTAKASAAAAEKAGAQAAAAAGQPPVAPRKPTQSGPFDDCFDEKGHTIPKAGCPE